MSAISAAKRLPSASTSKTPSHTSDATSVSRVSASSRALIQGSEAWLKERRKYSVTASEVATVCGHAYAHKSRNQLFNEKEGLVERVVSDFARWRMDFGTEYEAEARGILATLLDTEIRETGLWPHHEWGDEYILAGSPDGLFEEDGRGYCIEIKCHPPRAGECWVPSPARIDYDMVQLLVNIDCTGSDGGYLFYYQPPLRCHCCGHVAAAVLADGTQCCWTCRAALSATLTTEPLKQPSVFLYYTDAKPLYLQTEIYPHVFTMHKARLEGWRPALYSKSEQRELERDLWDLWLRADGIVRINEGPGRFELGGGPIHGGGSPRGRKRAAPAACDPREEQGCRPSPIASEGEGSNAQ